MSLTKWAGVLWLVAAVFSVVITVVFRIDLLQWIITIIAGIAAVIVGVLLIWRQTAGMVTWSTALGVAWLVIYLGLTFQQRREIAAWSTDVLIAALGAVATLVAYRQKASAQ